MMKSFWIFLWVENEKLMGVRFSTEKGYFKRFLEYFKDNPGIITDHILVKRANKYTTFGLVTDFDKIDRVNGMRKYSKVVADMFPEDVESQEREE